MKAATKKNLKNVAIIAAVSIAALFVITRKKGPGKTTMTEPFNQIKNLFT